MSILDLIESPHLTVISPEKAARLPLHELRRLRQRGVIVPPHGREDDEGAGGDGEGAGDGEGGDEGAGAGPGSGGADGGDGEGEGDGHEGELPEGALSKAEAEALRRRVAESEKKARDADRKLKAKDQQKAEAAGEYEKLYNDERTKNEELEGRFKGAVLKRTIVEVAARQNFRNPQLAGTLLSIDASDVVDDDFEADEKPIEAALKKLAKSDPYLVKPERGQADVTGGSEGAGRGKNGSGQRNGDAEVFGESRIRQAYAGT